VLAVYLLNSCRWYINIIISSCVLFDHRLAIYVGLLEVSELCRHFRDIWQFDRDRIEMFKLWVWSYTYYVFVWRPYINRLH